MSIKKFKPVTPSLRHRKILKSIPNYDYKFINKRKLKKGMKKTSGRNNQGIITSFRKGGGHKKSFRFIDHSYNNASFSLSKVIRVEYNPNSTNSIVLLKNNKNYFYRLAPQNIKIGNILEGIHFKKIKTNFPHLISSSNDNIQIGEKKFLHEIPIGTSIFDLSLNHQHGQIARAAGTSCKIIKKLDSKSSLVSFPTGQIKVISNFATAIVGSNSNPNHFNTQLGKAGASRWLGIRPRTRGEAMNPVDHPHGGKNHGSGGKGNPQKNRWGKLAKSKK